MINLKFTPTQMKLLAVLADGEPHSRDELIRCLDETADARNLKTHICNLRGKLRRVGHDVVCQYVRRGLHYRHVVPYRGWGLGKVCPCCGLSTLTRTPVRVVSDVNHNG